MMVKKTPPGFLLAAFFLWPLSYLYAFGAWAIQYIRRLRPIYDPGVPIISVGNLAMGGTGKTPCVAYCVQLLYAIFPVGIISRGYKRHSRGIRVATPQDKVTTLGDEPYQLYRRFIQPNYTTAMVHLAVGANKTQAIRTLLSRHPQTKVIVLDDGFQHRKVHRHLNILLTSFHQPFFTDHVLPLGQLRESKKAAQHADIMLVTKCPNKTPLAVKKRYQRDLKRYHKNPDIPIYFTQISYGRPQLLSRGVTTHFSPNIVLVTGIADPAPLLYHVKKHYHLLQHIAFPDHHWFTTKDIRKIVAIFEQSASKKKCILTTEKDSMRLYVSNVVDLWQKVPLFFLPMGMQFENKTEEEAFKKMVFNCFR